MKPPMLDCEGSICLARRIGLEHSRCFYNASRAVRDVPELHNASYVEGVAVIVVEGKTHYFDHGWIETADGTIVDPTLACHPGVRRRRVDFIRNGTTAYRLVWPTRYPLSGGQQDWPVAYFAASQFTREDVFRQTMPQGLPFSGWSHDPASSISMREAECAAEEAYPVGAVSA